MSADNGIYILKTAKYPTKQGNSYINNDGYEYRVALCQAIDNIDYSDLYMAIYFSTSAIFEDEEEAFRQARVIKSRIEKDGEYIEYGICLIDMTHKYFPNITARAARKVLDCYEGCVPLDCQN